MNLGKYSAISVTIIEHVFSSSIRRERKKTYVPYSQSRRWIRLGRRHEPCPSLTLLTGFGPDCLEALVTRLSWKVLSHNVAVHSQPLLAFSNRRWKNGGPRGKQKEWKRYETLPQAPSVEVVIAF